MEVLMKTKSTEKAKTATAKKVAPNTTKSDRAEFGKMSDLLKANGFNLELEVGGNSIWRCDHDAIEVRLYKRFFGIFDIINEGEGITQLRSVIPLD
jgi:hypothetical protein